MKIKPNEIKHFTTNLRRVLYLMQVLGYEMQSLKSQKVTPHFMKDGVTRVGNAVGKMLSDCMYQADAATWDAVKSDLTSEQLHDISRLLEWSAGVKNIGTVVDALMEIKPEPEALAA